MQIRHADSSCESGDLRSIPRDREKDRRVSKNAEVIRIVNVFPDVLAGKDKILSNGLFYSRVKLVAPSRAQRSRCRCGASKQWIQDRTVAANAGNDQVLVEWRLQQSRVGNAKHCVAALYVVRNSKPWFRFLMRGQSVVEIPAQAHIERPSAFCNLILDV